MNVPKWTMRFGQTSKNLYNLKFRLRGYKDSTNTYCFSLYHDLYFEIDRSGKIKETFSLILLFKLKLTNVRLKPFNSASDYNSSGVSYPYQWNATILH